MTTKKMVTLEDILGRDSAVLTAVKTGDFEAEKLGTVPWAAPDDEEFKQIKQDCRKQVPDGTGGINFEVDEDKLMRRLVIRAVDKDTRSNFTFASKQLLEKFEVKTADQVVGRLLLPGEIVEFAVEIQNAMGFGKKADKERENAVKNS